MLIMIFSILFHLIFILISIMFFTLLERKFLGLTQYRKGPNKISIFGLLQPMSDGLKLFLNEQIFIFKSNKSIFLISPFIMFLVMGLFWVLMMYYWSFYSINFMMLLFMVFLGFSVYSLLGMSWSSNSKFSGLSLIRGMAQTISFELTMFFNLISIFIWLNSMNFQYLYYMKSYYFMFYLPIFFMWLINILAETGRAPFDFMEGESELVSGYSVEYSSMNFSLMMISEYGMMIFFSFFSCMLFFCFSEFYFLFFFFFFIMFFILIRSSFPRFRYDFLMNLAWKKMLPFSIFFFSSIFIFTLY